DFTNDDLVRETSLKEDYDAEIFRPEDADGQQIFLRLTPKEDTPTVWAKIEVVVRESDYLPVWQKFYNERDELVRIMEFQEIKEMGGKTIPTVMELTPQNKEGHKTIVRYKEVDFDIPLDDGIFSLRNLQKTR
ncbi:MAG TPA: outer membrane lipoprotein-sorting protein, partial [candidate division Zixibacteria bacterium]|nr:outer membrane lipoprotein-sorting protein [candidate division Zixibacteria bacterium]